MLDVHPPHHAANTWRDFFIHIATIVIGLLIAIGLEQGVEAVHHHRQRHQLEDQLLEVLDNDRSLIAVDLNQFGAFRQYLVELQAAVVAQRHGKPLSSGPPADDPRMKMSPRFPSLAPYEAAQQNGTVAVLPSSEIRLYNRIALQRTLLFAESQNWFHDLITWESFQQRFVDSKGSAGFGHIATPPNLKDLSPAEIIEYQSLIASLIKQTDIVEERLHYFDLQCNSVLNGNRDENSMINSLTNHPK